MGQQNPLLQIVSLFALASPRGAVWCLHGQWCSIPRVRCHFESV